LRARLLLAYLIAAPEFRQYFREKVSRQLRSALQRFREETTVSTPERPGAATNVPCEAQEASQARDGLLA
jgi:hypothetical protein